MICRLRVCGNCHVGAPRRDILPRLRKQKETDLTHGHYFLECPGCGRVTKFDWDYKSVDWWNWLQGLAPQYPVSVDEDDLSIQVTSGTDDRSVQEPKSKERKVDKGSPAPLWQRVKEMEDNHNTKVKVELNAIDSSLDEDYSKVLAETRPIFRSRNQSTMTKMMDVLNWYEKQLAHYVCPFCEGVGTYFDGEAEVNCPVCDGHCYLSPRSFRYIQCNMCGATWCIGRQWSPSQIICPICKSNESLSVRE